jgi:putative aldouronate transport system substrate-binding protein
MRKQWGAVLVTLALSTAVASGCSNSADSGGAGASPGDTASGSAGKSAGKVQLTAIVVKHPLTKPVAEMEWLKKAEEDAGVDIKWQEISADWGQKKGTLLASGDIPDLFIGSNVITDADFAQFQGLFQNLSDLIPKYAPNVQTMFSEKPETKAIATQPDGSIFGLPKYQRFWPGSATRQYINKKWLDNLGLSMPTTWDELYNVLVAFKQKNANGNGDVIPMDWPGGIGGYFNPAVLLGSEGITLTDGSPQGYFMEDGKVKNFLIDDRYKKLVQFLNKCFAAGLVNPEVFTHDYTKYQSIARGTGDTAKVGFTWGWVASDRFGEQVAPQYVSMPPLKMSADSNAKLSWSYDSNSLNYGTNMVVMSAKTKNKEAAMKFINQLYDPKVSMQVLFGSIGPNIKDNGDGSYSVLPPADSKMDPGTWKWTSTIADNGPMYVSDSLKLNLGKDMSEVLAQSEPLKNALGAVDTKSDVFPGMLIKYSTADNNTLSLNNTNLMNLANSKFAQWVTKGGIDAEWDAYVKECQKAGLQQNIDIMQKYYNDYKSKNK